MEEMCEIEVVKIQTPWHIGGAKDQPEYEAKQYRNKHAQGERYKTHSL